MNESKARFEVFKLFNDPSKIESWKNRPADIIQKEFFRFFGLKIPKGLTHEMASSEIKNYRKTFNVENEEKLDEWDNYESIYTEINDPGFREDYNLKNISMSIYRSAINDLKKEGKSLEELYDDQDIVIDKIIEIKPEIEKE